MNAFDKFFNEQMKSSSFAEERRHVSAQIAAQDRIKNANPDRPWPKFQVAYYLEDKYVDNNGKEKSKRVHFRGQPVGLRSNTNSGTIHEALWSDRLNQWTYTIYPWSGQQESKCAAEDMLVCIEQWMHSKMTDGEAQLCESLFKIDDNSPLTINIITHYRSLLSGRVSDAYCVINNLRKLLTEYRKYFYTMNSEPS